MKSKSEVLALPRDSSQGQRLTFNFDKGETVLLPSSPGLLLPCCSPELVLLPLLPSSSSPLTSLKPSSTSSNSSTREMSVVQETCQEKIHLRKKSQERGRMRKCKHLTKSVALLAWCRPVPTRIGASTRVARHTLHLTHPGHKFDIARVKKLW